MLKTELYISTETQEKITAELSKMHDEKSLVQALENIDNIFQTEVHDKMPASPKNILLIRLDEIGDMVVTSATIKNIRKKYPDAKITFACSPWVKNILVSCPFIDKIITVNKKKYTDMKFPNVLKQIWQVVKKVMLQFQFDTTFVLRHSMDAKFEATFAFLTGAVRRYSFNFDSNVWWFESSPYINFLENILLTKTVVVPPHVQHEADKQNYFMFRLGMLQDKELSLFYSKKDLATAEELLSTLPSGSKKVLVGIAASIRCRKYPVKRYLEVCNKLSKRYDLSFVIVGSDDEKDDAQFLEDNLPKDRVLNLCCKTTLLETEAVISCCDFYVGNDTGILHMAAAAKVPVVGLYRESPRQDRFPSTCAVKLFAPYKTEHVILRPDKPEGDCDDRKFHWGGCKHLNEPHCILRITVDDVINAFETLYNKVMKNRR